MLFLRVNEETLASDGDFQRVIADYGACPVHSLVAESNEFEAYSIIVPGPQLPGPLGTINLCQGVFGQLGVADGSKICTTQTDADRALELMKVWEEWQRNVVLNRERVLGILENPTWVNQPAGKTEPLCKRELT